MERPSLRSDHEREMLDLVTSALREAFDGVAEVELHHEALDPDGPDGLLKIRGSDSDVSVVIEVLRTAYPRDIHRAIWRLEEQMLPRARRQLHPIYLIAADELSPGAKADLKKRGYAYFERNGSLYLRTSKWLINIEHQSKVRSKTHLVDLFTEARAGVIHALLKTPYEWMTGTELSELAETSTYTCSIVMQELERREWCESQGAGRNMRRRLTKPGKLLDAWSEQWTHRAENSTTWYTFVEEPRLLLDRLTYLITSANIDFSWAFTGAAAANVYAPLLTSIDLVEIIVQPGHTNRLAEELKLKPAAKGGNVKIIERSGASLMFTEPHPEYSAIFASPYILYLDLLNGRGRNKELANYLREKLESRWEAT